jgi:hypothetical protein
MFEARLAMVRAELCIVMRAQINFVSGTLNVMRT